MGTTLARFKNLASRGSRELINPQIAERFCCTHGPITNHQSFLVVLPCRVALKPFFIMIRHGSAPRGSESGPSLRQKGRPGGLRSPRNHGVFGKAKTVY